jgi:hypothetical protein
MRDATPNPEAPRPIGFGWLTFFVAFGLYLLAGAYVGVRHAEWPIFMPPQLDLMALLLSVLGNPLGAYVASFIVALLGLGCVVLGIMGIIRRA